MLQHLDGPVRLSAERTESDHLCSDPSLGSPPSVSQSDRPDNPGLFGVGTHVIRFVVAVQRFTGRFFVEEDNWHVLAARFLDHRACRSRVNQLIASAFTPFCQKNVNLIVLFGLVILGVIHQQLHVWR